MTGRGRPWTRRRPRREDTEKGLTMRNTDDLRVSFADSDPDHPIGPVELGDEELTAAQGGSFPTLGWICSIIVTELCGGTSTGPPTVSSCLREHGLQLRLSAFRFPSQARRAGPGTGAAVRPLLVEGNAHAPRARDSADLATRLRRRLPRDGAPRPAPSRVCRDRHLKRCVGIVGAAGSVQGVTTFDRVLRRCSRWPRRVCPSTGHTGNSAMATHIPSAASAGRGGRGGRRPARLRRRVGTAGEAACMVRYR